MVGTPLYAQLGIPPRMPVDQALSVEQKLAAARNPATLKNFLFEFSDATKNPGMFITAVVLATTPEQAVEFLRARVREEMHVSWDYGNAEYTMNHRWPRKARRENAVTVHASPDDITVTDIVDWYELDDAEQRACGMAVDEDDNRAVAP